MLLTMTMMMALMRMRMVTWQYLYITAEGTYLEGITHAH
jgi:hypothetical protein